MKQGPLLGVAAIMLATLLWGTTGTAATFAPGVNPLAMGAAALGIGGLLQAAIAIPALKREFPALKQQRSVVFSGAAGVAIYPLAFYSSMHLSGVAIGTVVSLSSAPLASGIIDRCIEQTPINKKWSFAALLGITGSTLLCAAKLNEAPDAAFSTVLGIALGLIAGATYATYSWAAHRLIVGGVDRAAAMGATFGLGGLALLPVLALSGSEFLASAQNIGIGLYMALIPMFLGYWLFGFGLTRISARTATTLTLAEPAIAAVLAVWIVGESLPLLAWIGLGAIGISLLVLSLDRN